ncbi:ABC transporter substrate-binding protein [Microbacterium sp. KNMS]
MKRTWHRMAATLLGAGLIVGMAGCSGGTQGNTGSTGEYKAPESDIKAELTVSNWGNPGDEDLYDEAIARFNEKYPNVKVTHNFTQVTVWSDYINKILTSIAAGDAPDVINLATEGVEFALSKDLFLPLSNYVDQDDDVQSLIADIDPKLIEGFTKDGETYLMPNNWNTMVLYYNKSMFDAAGIERPGDDWTWDDFREISKKLTAGSGSAKTYGFAFQTYAFAYMPWLYSNGGSTASADLSEPALDSPEVIESVQFLQDLVMKDRVAPDPSGSDANQLFQAGKVGMTAAPASISAILANDSPDLDYGILPMPQKTEKKTVYGAAGFAIYKQSPNQDLAWELIKELSSQETQMGIAEIGANNPTTKTAAKSEAFTGRNEDAALLYDAIEYAEPVAAPTFFTTLEPAFLRALQAVFAGGDPAEELGKAQAEVESVANG